jgi:hypothetical protein
MFSSALIISTYCTFCIFWLEGKSCWNFNRLLKWMNCLVVRSEWNEAAIQCRQYELKLRRIKLKWDMRVWEERNAWSSWIGLKFSVCGFGYSRSVNPYWVKVMLMAKFGNGSRIICISVVERTCMWFSIFNLQLVSSNFLMEYLE